MADRKTREKELEHKITQTSKLREEHLQRDLGRWEHMEAEERLNAARLQVKAEVYGAAKKNKGGSAYDIISLNYQTDKDGVRLQQQDNDAKVRALMRSKLLDGKNNTGFNVITGEDRRKVAVPYHERYNPVLSTTGSQVVSAASRRSAASGIVPGLD